MDEFSGVSTAQPPQTLQCGETRRVEALCRWETEIVALGPKMSWAGADMAFSAGGGQNLKLGQWMNLYQQEFVRTLSEHIITLLHLSPCPKLLSFCY